MVQHATCANAEDTRVCLSDVWKRPIIFFGTKNDVKSRFFLSAAAPNEFTELVKRIRQVHSSHHEAALDFVDRKTWEIS